MNHPAGRLPRSVTDRLSDAEINELFAKYYPTAVFDGLYNIVVNVGGRRVYLTQRVIDDILLEEDLLAHPDEPELKRSHK